LTDAIEAGKIASCRRIIATVVRIWGAAMPNPFEAHTQRMARYPRWLLIVGLVCAIVMMLATLFVLASPHSDENKALYVLILIFFVGCAYTGWLALRRSTLPPPPPNDRPRPESPAPPLLSRRAPVLCASSDRSGQPERMPNVAPPTRGEDRHAHVERRLHSAPRLLQRALAADWPSSERAPPLRGQT
jgi:hypothetical protein